MHMPFGSASLLVVDEVNIAYPCWCAMTPRTGADGTLVHAIQGFFNAVRDVAARYNPYQIIIACEGASNPRKKIFPEYKAHRGGMPAEFLQQLPVIEDLCRAAGWMVVKPSSGEADDVIASAVAQVCARPAVLFTSDKDARSLLSEDVHIVQRHQQVITEIGPDEHYAKHQVTPAQWTDFLSLCGDTSDGVPGVDDIGPSKAATILKTFGSVDAAFLKLDQVPVKIRPLLEAGIQQFQLSRSLIRLDETIPIPAVFPTPDRAAFETITRRKGVRIPFPERRQPATVAIQGELF